MNDKDIVPNVAHEISEISLEVKKNICVYVPNYGDSYVLKHIVFTSNQILSIEQFKKVMYDDDLIFCNLCYSFNILMELNDVVKIGNRFIITVPFDFTFGEYYCVKFDFTHNTFDLQIHNHEMIEKISIFIDNILYDTQFRNHIHKTNFSNMIQNIKICNKYNGNSKDFTVDLNHEGDHIIKGYFIEGDISKIIFFQLFFNGHERFSGYDTVGISLYCHKISDNMFYYSPNGFNNYKDFSINSYYSNYLNVSEIQNIKIRFKIDDKNNENININVYCVSLEYITYHKNTYEINSKIPPYNMLTFPNDLRDKYRCYSLEEINSYSLDKHDTNLLNSELISNNKNNDMTHYLKKPAIDFDKINITI